MARIFSRKYPLPAKAPAFWSGAILSSAVGLLFYLLTAKSIESDSEARFASMARNAQSGLNNRILSYTNVLRGAASLFESQGSVDATEFHHYVDGLHLARHFPGIVAANFARAFTQAERANVEAQLRRELARVPGYPAFEIKPAGIRPDYSVVAYVSPVGLWSDRVGLDMLADRPLVTRALLASRDSGDIATSGVPLPRFAGPSKTGLGMRLPVYRKGLALDTVAQRRAAYIGSVGIALSVSGLVQGVLEDLPAGKLRLRLVDHLGGAVLYDSTATEAAPRPSPPQADQATFAATVPVDFNGRTWDATVSMKKAKLYTAFDRWYPWAASVAGFAVTATLYALFHTLSSSRRRALQLAREMTRELRDSQSELQASHENLRRLAAHADQIKEDERKRIAREIHDDLGQNLLALRIEADVLYARTSVNHPRLASRAHATRQQIDKTIKSVRHIINDLRPTVLDLGLDAAVEWLIGDFRQRTGIACALDADELDTVLEDHVAIAFFRILQESLNNVLRHSGAQSVRVSLWREGALLCMEVADNGCGMPRNARAKHQSFGLVGIEERIKILGGSFSLNSTPGRGTTIRIAVGIHPVVVTENAVTV